jgi:APA family basic amino acid/polyamine antiporter
MGLWTKKSIAVLQAEAAGESTEHTLRRALGALNLTTLGIGAIIGAGIFVLTGTAAAKFAGPAIVLSFIVSGFGCLFAGLCYAEFASMIPIAGSAYTYGYATLGEFVAWIIGWDLILEYAVSNMAVAVGFSAYVNSLLNSFGVHLPDALSTPAYQPGIGWLAHFNLVGFLIVMLLTVLLVTGIKESATSNSIMVGIKLIAIFVFIVFASKYINPINWKPFAPNGFQGILTGGAIVFFSYIGFDSVSTAAEECKNPKRDLPLGIMTSLLVCAALYVGVAVVLTGIQPYHIFKGDAAPVATALHNIGLDKLQRWVTIGALMGMISSLLVYQYGQARVWFAMSRDGLLPAAFSKVHKKFRTPHFATWIAGIVVGIPAGIFDIGTLADLSNIGTLFAFVLVAIAVLVLRKSQPDRARGFRVPLVPFLPILSIVTCVILMASLTLENWIRFFVWLIIGLVIYFVYSRHRSTLNTSPRA